MLYLLELMANGTIEWGLVLPIKEPNVLSATVSETAAVLPRFLLTQMGTIKWTDAIRNSWTSKCEGLHRHEMTA
jgi:hypothetical protein